MKGGGLYLTSVTAVLRNNYVADNAAGDDAGAAATVVSRSSASATLVHNTFVGPSGTPRGSGLAITNGARATLTNNIVARFDTGLSASLGAEVALEGTLWGSGSWGNIFGVVRDMASTVTLGDGNETGDPDFLSASVAGGRYRLGALSAARDSGLPTALAVDHDGKPRDDQPDIGADEYIDHPLVLYPDGGERFKEGDVVRVRWAAPGNAEVAEIEYSLDGGATWELVTSEADGRSENWVVPETDRLRSACYIRVKCYTAGMAYLGRDTSDGPFAIRDLD
jgi:hypothetical protein